jgi:preprotein translocase SecE subunit
MISLFAVPVFADETTAAATDVATDVATETATEAATTESTTAATTTGTTASTGGSENGDKKDEGLSTTAIIWIVVGAVIVIVLAVLGIKFRANIAKALRVYKSEFKKVSWLSWEQTRKSTLVVVVFLVAFALVIGLLDMGLFNGFELLLKGFAELFK